MRTFDLYHPAGTKSQGFFEAPVAEGSMIWIEKGGFHDGYFRERQTKDLIEMAILPNGIAGLPREATAFENVLFLEAEVLEPKEDSAKIIVRSVTTLGEWARGAHTLGKDNVQAIPETSRPQANVMDPLLAASRSNEGVVWVSDAAPSDPASPSAVYLFKCDFDKRCLVLTSSAAASFLVKL